MKCFPLWLLAFATAALAQTEPPQLTVVSTSLDPQTNSIDVKLLNGSDKLVVAYTLECRQFDAAGKELGAKPQVVTYDNVRNLVYEHEPDLARYKFILPRTEAPSFLKFTVMPDAVTAKVSVLAVVYRDRTAEGARHYIDGVFKARADSARKAAERGEKDQASVLTANSKEAQQQ